ncbi:MAG: hypothetical protein M3Z24_16695, partial [Chloroflexota bacterium]|nr:hypothetical protein [Chloroflexota bacterium]
SPPLTTAGNEMGTAAYMAPERLSGIAAPSNDIYSLGIILYQMLTGRLPSKDDPAVALPKPLEHVIKYCTAPNPEHRFKTADDLLKAFEDTCTYLETSTKDDPSGTIVIRNKTFRSSKKSKPELKAVPGADMVPPIPPVLQVPPVAVHPVRPAGFTQEDYAAPTTHVGKQSTQAKPENMVSPSSVPVKRKTRRKNPLLAIITLIIVLILLIMAGLFAFEFQSIGFVTVKASISISPQVHVVKQVFHITARPGQKTVAVDTTSIPANVFSSSKTRSQTGPTSGLHCDLGIFNCQQSVDASDVDTLAAQLKQSLQLQITQDLQSKVQKANAKVVGTARFADLSEASNPNVGAISKTVTVTLTEQGSMEYMLPGDAQTLARQLLTRQVHQLGANYSLLSATLQMGQPIVTSVDANGVISIDVAAAGLAQYQFSKSEIQNMQNRLKGLKLATAIATLKSQPGVDPQSVSISLSSGTTLPTDTSEIKMFPHSPGSLPSLNLPSVTATSLTPSTSNNTNSTPPAVSPTADATPTT